MAGVKHRKPKKNLKNEGRRNGKAWKQGKPPAVRDAEAREKKGSAS